jgi:hypothetical protein
MTTLMYGSIIKLLSTESKYDDTFFFVERLDDNELCLVDENTNKLVLTITNGNLDDDTIKSITIVYKPYEDFIKQNRLFEKQWIEIQFEDLTSVNGQITKTAPNIEVQLKENIIYIPYDKGLPKGILSIKKISKPINYQTKKEEGEPTGVEELDQYEENEVIGYIEEEKENENVQYFYSIEQQTSDLLEHLIMYIPEDKRTPSAIKKFTKIIKRYKELRDKYTDFDEGIKIHHLPTNQILDSTLHLKNKTFMTTTKNINIFLFPEDETDITRDYFTVQDDSNFVYRILGELNKENNKYQNIKTLTDEFINNIINNKKLNSKKSLFKPDYYENVLLYDKETILNSKRYIIRIDEPYVVHSLVSHPLSYIEHLKTEFRSSNIIDKANYARIPFFSLFYNSIQHNVKNTKTANYLMFNDKYVYYENKTDNFNAYVEKLIPSLNNYLDVGIENEFISPFYNYYQAIKNLESLNISELNNVDYNILKGYVNEFVTKYKRNMTVTKLPQKQSSLYIPNISFESIMNLYKDILPKSMSDTYYSSSEILKHTIADYNNYYYKTFIKTIKPQNITENDIQEVKAEIEGMLQSDVKEQINKIYKTEQEREIDRANKIILQDVNGMSGLEYIYRQLMAQKIEVPSLEKLKQLVDTLIIFNLDITKIKSKKEISIEIKKIIEKIQIIDNHLAYVEESKKTYRRLNNEWVNVEDPRCADTKKLVSVKGTCKESEYSERVRILLDKIAIRKQQELKANSTEKEIDADLASQLLISMYNKYHQEDIKYNTEKERYASLEIQKEIQRPAISPYLNLRDRIIAEPNIEFKYKAVQLFISKFTKTGADKYWLYCIETSAKLMPNFFLKLANAYLVTNNIEQVEDEICLDQGTLSDNGDKWVDKYSGYIIKNIEFDKEEGYDAKGYKVVTREAIEESKDAEIFSEDVMEELAKDKFIKTVVKVLFNYLGVTYIEDDALIEFINISFKRTNAENKDANTQKLTLLYVIIAHVFIFIQTYPTKLKITKPFPNCKFSFAGYPLIEDETRDDGLKYVACVIKELAKGGEPWKLFTKGLAKKELMEETLISNIQRLMKNIILKNSDIMRIITKKRLTYIEEDVLPPQKNWHNFLPRLKPIKPVIFREQQLEDMDDLKDRIYYLSFLVQREIHKKIAAMPLILTDTFLNPYLVNACCNKEKDNYTYRYFLKNTAISDYLKEIITIKRPLRKLEKLLINQKTYFQENTIKQIPSPTKSFSEETMYMGIIKMSEINPQILEEFKIPLPILSKTDKLSVKIAKMKEQNIIINEETFVNLLQKSNSVIEKPKETEEDILEDDKIIQLLPNESELANYLDENITKMLSVLKKYDPTPKFLGVLNFNKTILSNKTNLLINSETEHYTHINQILYNKIQFLLCVAPEIVRTKKDGVQDVVCKHWNLASVHNSDIENNVNAYYSNFYDSCINDELLYTLKLIHLDKYKNLMKIQIYNQKLKNLLYYYIFISIFYEYKTFKSESNATQHKFNINVYLTAIISIFDREDKLALNFDTSRVKYEINIAKKSETKIKTDYFKSLSKDARKAEGVLKEHKLEKWGVGLQKGMFQYVKANYLKDKMDAAAILENIGQPLTEEISIDEEVVPSTFDPLDDPNEYAENVDEDYDNENEE